MASFDVAGALHADRHATGGSDPITPESIGAVPDQDTGWRTFEFLGTVAGSTQVMRRVGPWVILKWSATVAAGRIYMPTVLPMGFHLTTTTTTTTTTIGRWDEATDAGKFGVNTSGTTRAEIARAGTFDATLRYLTDDPFPTEPYPGTPA